MQNNVKLYTVITYKGLDNMIIDFHTHIFPEKIAKPTIEKLKGYLCEQGEECSTYTDGTIDSLFNSMKESGVDKSVILPVVTAPHQFESINRFSAAAGEREGFIAFGGIHPDNDNIEEKLDYIKALGMKGIKLHPDYQNTYINDERYIKIISYAEKIGLITVIHCGYDPLSPQDLHCPVDLALEMLEKVGAGKENKIVLAHMGGHHSFEESFEKLCGKNVWLDTSYVMNKIEPSFLVKMFKKHGFDKILFATDSPWGNQKEFVKTLQELNISNEEREKIAYKNATHLLTLNL